MKISPGVVSNFICIKSFYKLYPSNIILEIFNSSAASRSLSASELLLTKQFPQRKIINTMMALFGYTWRQ